MCVGVGELIGFGQMLGRVLCVGRWVGKEGRGVGKMSVHGGGLSFQMLSCALRCVLYKFGFNGLFILFLFFLVFMAIHSVFWKGPAVCLCKRVHPHTTIYSQVCTHR